MTKFKALIMAIILLGGVWYLTRYEQQGEDKVAGQKELSLYDPVDASFLAIERKEKTLTLERMDGSWQMLDPLGAPTDIKIVKRVISALSRIETRATIEKEQVADDKSAFGLNPPELTIVVAAGNNEHKFKFGKLHPLSGRRYLQIDTDDRLYLVDSMLFHEVDVVEGQVRESRPYQFNVADVSDVFVKPFAKDTIQFSRESLDLWRIYGKGRSLVVDSAQIDSLLRSLDEYKVEQFVDVRPEDLKVLSLDPADVQVEIRFKAETKREPLVILFGAAKRVSSIASDVQVTEKGDVSMTGATEEHFSKLSNAPWVYKMSAPIERSFIRPLEAYRPKEVFSSVSLDNVRRIEVKRGGDDVIELKKTSEGKWAKISRASVSEVADSERVAQFIQVFSAVKPLAFEEQSESGKAPSDLTLTVELDSQQKVKLSLGQAVRSEVDQGNQSKAPRFARIDSLTDIGLGAVISFDDVQKLEDLLNKIID